MEVKVFPEPAAPVILIEMYEQFFDGHCPTCGATEHRYVNHRTRTVQTLGRWGQPYWLEFECSLLKCRLCGLQFVPEHPRVPPRHRVSWDVIYHAFHLRGRQMSEQMIVEMLEFVGVFVSQPTLNRWFRDHTEKFMEVAHEETDPIPPAEVIAVDGLRVKTRTATESWASKTLLVATDTIADRPIHMELADGETLADVVPFLQRLRAKLGGDPKLFVTDMGFGLLGGLNRVFPDVPKLVDAYHYYAALKDQAERYSFEAEYDRVKPYLDQLFRQTPRGAVQTFALLEQIERRLTGHFQAWFRKQTQLLFPLVTVVPFLSRYEGYAWRTNKESMCKRIRRACTAPGPRTHGWRRVALCDVSLTVRPIPIA